MKLATRLLTVLVALAGCIGLVRLSVDNQRLENQLDQLESKLGKMSIDDPNRIHIVAIDSPDVPPEVADRIERIWQFRCYLPAGYDGRRMSGSGRVTRDGVYHQGSSGSSWNSPDPEPIHRLLTVSMRPVDGRIKTFVSFGSSGGTSTWNRIEPKSLDSLVVHSLVSADQGTRSFDQETILPLLKLYDPNTAETRRVGDEELTTYIGGQFVLYPTVRETDFEQLRNGVTPTDFDPDWIASEAEP